MPRSVPVLAAVLLTACSPAPDPVSQSTPTVIPKADTRTPAPFGSWQSPISAAKLATAAIAMSDLRVHAGAVYWRESRPAERGRQVLMRRTAEGQIETLTPADFNVRTRVHEYGGNSYLVTDRGIVFTNFADQRLYWQTVGGAAPVPLTPAGYQYADGIADVANGRMLWIREDHTEATKAANGEERNEIVALPLPGDAVPAETAGRVLATGADFYAYPRLSADGRSLAFLSWDHPAMPWDRTRLHTAALDPALTGAPLEVATLLDDPRVALLEPWFAADGTLHVIGDTGGWWTPSRWDGTALKPLATLEREFGGPLWQLGTTTLVPLGDGRAVARSSREAVDQLGLIDLATGAWTAFDLPYVAYGEVQLLGSDRAVTIAQSSDDTAVLIAVDLADGRHTVLHQPTPRDLAPEWISKPEAIRFATTPGPDGAAREAHAWYYPPTNPAQRGPDGEKPPLIVTIHGGPTSVSKGTLALARQYWTSRGFALVDVNYGGSTSYGRAYRERLNGQWGIVDVADAIAAVDHLVAAGKVDPERLAIRGGSAGGYTTLAALAFHDRFKAGANLFGVSDIAALAATSHKFERQYDVSLVGPPDEALYRSRSPLYHLDGFTEPLITLQGSEDKIVPPAQSRAIVEALDARGVPHAYLEFEGEQHGFRQSANIIRAQEAELYFYGQIFGFTPADAIEPVAIQHWPRTP
ncbi:MAG: prolyl oligopeptidase family serine peptidase [Xanthomonadales bacterium]|jgi:dipeptidyl aminopeptidase/acylaminoacyl peptidase|nr:prolyl oligopeptidase family serine peptidase [Xanthomonadales bacterium]